MSAPVQAKTSMTRVTGLTGLHGAGIINKGYLSGLICSGHETVKSLSCYVAEQ